MPAEEELVERFANIAGGLRTGRRALSDGQKGEGIDMAPYAKIALGLLLIIAGHVLVRRGEAAL
jgi:hypothetical protein